MATTTNYGWATPDDTALVKDGASAIRTLGSSIDTTTKNLNPSTTLGDIEYRSSTANTNTRLGIGSTGNVLTVAGGVPTWAAPASSSTFSGAKVYRTSAITLANATATKIAFNTEEFDTNSYHDNTTNNTRLTVPQTGYYQISAFCFRDSQISGLSRFSLFKNGSNLDTTYFGSGAGFGTQTHPINTVLYLTASDYIELDVYQSSGGNIDFYFTTNSGYFIIQYLGA